MNPYNREALDSLDMLGARLCMSCRYGNYKRVGIAPVDMEIIEATANPGVAHITFQIIK